jgi:Reverse transcriptase (RNA-dependent DNA polymerase).
MTDATHAKSLAAMVESLGRNSNALAAAIRRAPRAYDPIRLMSKGGKIRLIHRPRAWLKDLQRDLYERMLLRVPISDRVYNVRGRGVLANATAHLGQQFMLALDISNCFPSTSSNTVASALARCGFDSACTAAVTRLTTVSGILPQGPPTSPAILNLVLAPLDEELAELADRTGARYTRYMDDLCFSANFPIATLGKAAPKVLRKFGYQSNPKKFRSWGPGDRHTVTGIVVTTELNPEPEFLQALASSLKEIRRTGKMTNQTRGRLAWLEALNPRLAAEVYRTRRLDCITPVRKEGIGSSVPFIDPSSQSIQS